MLFKINYYLTITPDIPEKIGINVRIFDPEKIIVGGDIIASNPPFLEAMRTTFRSMQPDYVTVVPEIHTAHFGERSTAIGGATIMLSTLFHPSQMGHAQRRKTIVNK